VTDHASNPADLDAVTARALIGRKALSPLELADACIARVETLNPAVNAVVAHDFDRLRATAKEAEAAVAAGADLGPLHGLPVAIKDERAVAGLPTTHGSPLFAGIVSEADDPMVTRLRRAGALILGKTNLSEWSAGANTRNRVHGVTVNPYDRSRSSAGSSGGSAVALACRMAPLATGSDLGGSLRNPAAFCGITGMRPSTGMVPDPGREMTILPLSTDGPMARTPRDAAMLLSVMAGIDGNDPWAVGTAPDGLWPLRHVDLAGLRVAVSEDLGFAPTETAIRNTFRDRVERLASLFGRVERDTPPCADADRVFSVLRGLLFLGAHAERVDSHPDDVGPNVRANVAEARSRSATDIADAMRRHGHYLRGWTAFFERYDILLCPAVTVSPRPWRELFPEEIDGKPLRNYYHWLALAYAVSVAGHPAISIPCGRDSAGLPFGLQIVGRRGEDAAVLAIAQALAETCAGDPMMCLPAPDLPTLSRADPIEKAPAFREI
jgi:Asp-tRNA(Asn)/Glu-tRNA(Gln) amidotransferase A subunit family amidase